MVLAGLVVYQTKAKAWEAQEIKNQEKIARIEAYNKQIEQENQKIQQKEIKRMYEKRNL